MLFLLTSIFAHIQIPADINFRINTRDGWIGPKTKFEGTSGYAVIANSTTVLSTILEAKRKVPEVICIPISMVKKDVLTSIQEKYHPKQFLQAVFVYPDNNSVTSSAPRFPNKNQSCYQSDYEWNPYGNGEELFKYDFPMFYPPKAYGTYLINKIIADGSKAGFFVQVHMYSRGSIENCLEEGLKFGRQCDIIGGLSLIGSFNENLTGKSVWAITNFDSFGIFPYGQIGADYSISGYVTLLSALESLKSLDWKAAKKNLRFAFFDAEETGYMGSSRFINDIKSFDCKTWVNDTSVYCKSPYRTNMEFMNMSIDDFESIVEVKSVGLCENCNTLYAHTMKTANSTDFVNDIKSKVSSPLSIQFSSAGTPGIPPSSTHSFIKELPSIPHVVFTGYSSQFINQNVGKPSDSNYNISYIVNASTTLARTLASLCFDTPDLNSINVNYSIVDELMKAFVEAPYDSQYVRNLLSTYTIPKDHVSLYSNVYKGYSYDLKHRVVEELLKDVIATNVTSINCTYNVNCTKYFGQYGYCSNAGVCESSKMLGHPAYSMGVEKDETSQAWKVVNNDYRYPLMAESVWSSVDVKYVLLPNYWIGRITFGLSCIVTVSLCIISYMYWNNTMSEIKG